MRAENELAREFALLATDDDRPVKDHFPAVSRVLVDDNDAVWVQEYPRPTARYQTWLHFAPDGELLCRLALDTTDIVSHISSESVLVVRTDSSDVERITILTIDPTNSQ